MDHLVNLYHRREPVSPDRSSFALVADYRASGDQPPAIAELARGVQAGCADQVLLGVTGSGKTFTMASIIAQTRRPALVLAHNKTLAAQLYGEFKSFFPDNHVEYFVSYYDYYQPEAYVPRTNTYIEKDSSRNETIDRMRHAATRAILEHGDVIIVASVSCIFGLGSVESYSAMTIDLAEDDTQSTGQLVRDLIALQYARNDTAFQRGTLRVRGDSIDLWPAHLESRAWRISFFGDRIERLDEFDPLTGARTQRLSAVRVYANSHYITPRPTLLQAVARIREEAAERTARFEADGKLLEAQRLKERIAFDIEMMIATGSCSGIENYSRYLTGRQPGQPPPTLFEYLPDNALLFVDESHQTVPQLSAMYKGDRSRKHTLSEYGFRLPSCMDNRPLKFEEWNQMRPQTVYVSATPGPWETSQADGVVVEQVIRPTGLVDPPVELRPVSGDRTSQVDDVIAECRLTSARGLRVLVTTLTKKSAEDLSEYMLEQGIRARYMHSDTDIVERIEIIRDLRLGSFDVLIGINLLREGLDIPECGLVAVLDADKEGFLRSETSLIQTIGRAARNARSRVILYADRETGSIRRAMAETDRRRSIQTAYNEQHRITPVSVERSVSDILPDMTSPPRRTRKRQRVGVSEPDAAKADFGDNLAAVISGLEADMQSAAASLEFEKAAELRDQIAYLRQDISTDS